MQESEKKSTLKNWIKESNPQKIYRSTCYNSRIVTGVGEFAHHREIWTSVNFKWYNRIFDITHYLKQFAQWPLLHIWLLLTISDSKPTASIYT